MDTNKIYTTIPSEDGYDRSQWPTFINDEGAMAIPPRRRELNLDPELIEKARQDHEWIMRGFERAKTLCKAGLFDTRKW